MPIVLDGGTFNVSLQIDADKPEATRPAFVCKYLTCRQVLKYETAIRAAGSEKDQPKANGLLTEALGMALTGWVNLYGEFSPDALDDVLSVQEKWELVYKVLVDMQATEADKKKSLSKSHASGGNSVPDAAAESAATPTQTGA